MGVSKLFNSYEWNLVTNKGKLKGIDIMFDCNIDRNRAFYACIDIFERYGLNTEIKDMYAELSGIPVEIRDMPLHDFKKKYGESPDIDISYLEVWGKKPSLRAKVLGLLPPYVWLTAGRASTSLWARDLPILTNLEILKGLSDELGLGIDIEKIERDIKDFNELKL